MYVSKDSQASFCILESDFELIFPIPSFYQLVYLIAMSIIWDHSASKHTKSNC